MKKFKILALDGGGIKGLYSVVVLKRIEEILQIKLKDEFNLIAGTSTGSILASAIVMDIPITEVMELYTKEGKKIFKKNMFGWKGLIRSRYSNKNLEQILNRIFGDTKMGEIKKPLMIIASDILNGAVYIHKSNYLPKKDYVRDGNTKLSEAVLSSCSAPTYFDPVELENNYMLSDGALWANNPSIMTLIDAIKIFHIPMKDIQILSVGTGSSKINYKKRSLFGWGFLTGWKEQKFIDYWLELSGLSSCNMSKLLLDDDSFLRVNGNVDYAMDNVKDMGELIAFADKCFLSNKHNIEKFFHV